MMADWNHDRVLRALREAPERVNSPSTEPDR